MKVQQTQQENKTNKQYKGNQAIQNKYTQLEIENANKYLILLKQKMSQKSGSNLQEKQQTNSNNWNAQNQQQNKQQNLKQKETQNNKQDIQEIPIQKINKQNLNEEEEVKNIVLLQCKNCERKFQEQALIKHEKICKKVFTDKPKVFDSSKQRAIIDEKDVQQIQKLKKKSSNTNNNQQQGFPQNKIPKWKLESLKFRQAMRVQQGSSNIPLNKQEQEDALILQQAQEQEMIQCEICNRKFNKIAGERHIAFCKQQAKNMKFKNPNGKNNQIQNLNQKTQQNKIAKK